MNATLQCLAHLAPLSRAVAAGAASGGGGGWGGAARVALVTSLLRACAKLFGALEAGGGGSVSPRELKALCASALTDAGTFNNYAQHDAHELLRFFLDALAEATNAVRARPRYVELVEDARAPDGAVAALWWAAAAERCASPIADLFRGQVKSTVTCGACGAASRSFDVFEELMLPLSRGAQAAARAGGAARLEDLLAATTAPEALEGADAWTCPACRAPRRAAKRAALWRAPRVLVLVLKRFYFTALRRCKVDTPVAVPLLLDARPLFDDDAPPAARAAAARYALVGAVNHMGDTHGGHYTADCRVGGAWMNFNDSRVSPGAPPRASSAPYILFYEAQGGEGEEEG